MIVQQLSAVVLQVVAVVALLLACALRDGSRRSRRGFWAVAGAALVGSLVLAGDAHVLRKWLARFAMPMGWFFMLALGSACWFWWHRRRREAVIATGSLVLLSVCGNVWVSQWLLRRLESGWVVPDPTDPPFDAVVVLGGGTGTTPDGRPQLTPSGDRVAMAARLHHKGLAPRIVASGSAIAALGGSDEALGEDTRALLVGMGVPDGAVEQLVGPKTTSEEMRALAHRAPEAGWKRVGLITSAWHLPRAMRLAERSGIEGEGVTVVPIPADYRGTRTMVTIVHLLPSEEGLGNLRIFLWEILGMAMGR